MPRRPAVDRPTQLCLKLPESLRTRLDLALFSALERRVPQGAYQLFFAERIAEWLSWRRIDLHPWGFPPGYVISGPPEVIAALLRRIQEQKEPLDVQS